MFGNDVKEKFDITLSTGVKRQLSKEDALQFKDKLGSSKLNQF